MASPLRELSHLRIPLEEIENATNNFADENIIGKGGLGNVYKGQLLRDGKLLNVSARRFNGKNWRKGIVEFLTEIYMLSNLNHQDHHIVSMIGFCAEKREKIIVYRYQSNQGSLVMHLSDPDSFTWQQRMELSLRVAKAIIYLHAGTSERKIQDSEYQRHHPDFKEIMLLNDNLIIHRNINSSTILLDENMTPRLSGFEYSVQQPVDQKDVHIHLCKAIGTYWYMDPADVENKGVSHKSDVYSFGVVLFEILCGRKAYQDNKSLAELAKFHYEHGTLEDIILPDLWKQMDPISFKHFSEAAYSCLKTEWTLRPDIVQVWYKLGRALNHDDIEPEETLKDVKVALPNYNKNLENKAATWEDKLKMCIDNANELHYLHKEMEAQKTSLIHDDSKGENIVLDDINLAAKIVKYRDSIFHKDFYMDPEFFETNVLCKESDVFGFGVLMFEIVSGFEASELLTLSGQEGMMSLIQTRYHNDSIKKSLLGVISRGNGDSKLFLNKPRNEDSLSTFLDIVCQCVGKKRSERPTMEVVVEELKKALTFQENYNSNFRISFEVIKLATQNFSRGNVIGGGGFGWVYKGKLADENGKGYYPIVAKKLNKAQGQGDKEFYTELQILCEYKHENIIGLVGYSNETDEKIIVYEHASKGSLDKYLNDASLTWRNRLKICIDFATGLTFLHEGEHAVIHRDIKSYNILLFDDWKAKVGDFGLSVISATNSFTIDSVCGTTGYVDPLYLKWYMLTKESDIYSFGVVLFEILCGKPINDFQGCKSESLLSFVERSIEERKEDDLVFKAIDEEIVPRSLATFLRIICRCLHDDSNRRPSSKEVLQHLKMALNFQGGDFKLDDIKFATQNFSPANEIQRGNFGSVYRAEFVNEDRNSVVAKKFDTSIRQGKTRYYNEFKIVSEYRHPNIIGLVGHINEVDEKILVYENAPKGSLDKYLSDASLTWTTRLKICIDFAMGLSFLHEGVDEKEVVLHRNIKSSNILLFDDWKAKVGGFSVSSKISKKTNCTIDLAPGYTDPQYLTSGMLTIESDIYSIGVVLFEILCGKVVYGIHKHESESLLNFIKHYFENGIEQDQVVFKGIKEEIARKSLTRFQNIIYQCLDDDPKKRPSSEEVLHQLKGALIFQEASHCGCHSFMLWLLNDDI